MLPALASNEPPPIRLPPSQLSSMKRMIDDWMMLRVVDVIDADQGEMTRNGWRGPDRSGR